jgi:hypothetical protein
MNATHFFTSYPEAQDSDEEVQVYQFGSTVLFDSGHSMRVHESAKEVADLMGSGGYEEVQWVWLTPWWQIDDQDQVAVKVARVIAVRNIRDTSPEL